MGTELGVPVADATRYGDPRRRGDDLRSRDPEQRLQLCHLDRDSCTRAVALLEGGLECQETVHPGEGVRAPARGDGPAVGASGDMSHPTRLFEGWSPGDVVAKRTVESERRHADHDQPRVRGAQGLDVEAEMGEHPGGEVLDEDVGFGDEPAGEPLSVGVREVQGEAALVEVGRLPDRAPLPPIVTELGRRRAVPERVRSGAGLHLEDVGAERSQEHRDDRSSPIDREIDDLEARVGETGATATPRRSGGRGDRSGSAGREPPRRARDREAELWGIREGRAGDQLRMAEQSVAVHYS